MLWRNGKIAMDPACCCEEGCCNAPSILVVTIDSGACSVSWNTNPFDATISGVTNKWTGATEGSGDCGVIMDTVEIWCDCTLGIYYLEIDGTLSDGYGTPYHIGPVASTSVDCTEATFAIVFTFDASPCCGTITFTCTPKAGASWSTYCASP